MPDGVPEGVLVSRDYSHFLGSGSKSKIEQFIFRMSLLMSSNVTNILGDEVVSALVDQLGHGIEFELAAAP